ncbi:MAG: biotin synthase BioB [Bacillota bacterium]
MNHKKILKKVLDGKDIKKDEALWLLKNTRLNDLLKGSLKIKVENKLDDFEFCSIINAKSGNCSENCKFCAQSSFYDTEVETYDLLPYEKIFKKAQKNQEQGIEYFSLVTTGKGIKDEKTFTKICEIIEKLKDELEIKICASLGIISKAKLKKLKKIGLDRYHHNLETSKEFYKKICSTHSYEERLQTIKNAKEIGLEVCSGGLIGLGEKESDFLDLAFLLKDLKIKSIPVNVLSPVENTPMEDLEILQPEVIAKRLAILRYIFPKAILRLAGGRMYLQDYEKICIKNIVNASITGDLLTTTGSNVKKDFEMINSLGY